MVDGGGRKVNRRKAVDGRWSTVDSQEARRLWWYKELDAVPDERPVGDDAGCARGGDGADAGPQGAATATGGGSGDRVAAAGVAASARDAAASTHGTGAHQHRTRLHQAVPRRRIRGHTVRARQ